MGLTRPRAYQIFDLDYKQSVRVITTTNVTLTGGAPSSVDGVSLSGGDRILVAGQSTGSQNGLYQVSILGTGSDGTWIRSVDGNETGEIDAGMIVMVTEGEVYKDTQWKLTTNDPIIIGTTALVFEQNSAFAFGNIYANGTAVLADIVGDTVTFTPGNNFIITGNATSDTITFAVSQSPTFTGNVSGSNISTAGQATATGNITGGNIVSNARIDGGNLYLTSLDANKVVFTGANGQLIDSQNFTFDDVTANIQGALIVDNVKIDSNSVSSTVGNLLLEAPFVSVLGNVITSGIVSANNNLIVNSTGGEGGQLVMAWAGINGLTGQANSTWNLDVDSSNNLRAFSVNAVGTANVILNVNSATRETTFGGNLLPSANITYNLGSPTQRWNEIFLAGNTIDIGGATISADLETGSLVLRGPTGAEFILTGSSPTDSFGIFGLIEAGNTEPSISTTTGALTVAGGAGIAGNLHVGEIFKATGNVEGGNLTTTGQITVTGNITGGNLVTAGNVTAEYFLGNVSQASGIFTTKIFNGTSEANIVSSGGNLEISIDGTSDVVVVSTAGLETTGILTATGNVTGSNINTAGQVTATGNITGGNLSGASIVGTLTTAAQTNVTSVGTLISLSVTGNINGGNVSGTRGAFTAVAGTLETAAQPNITSVGTLTSLDVSGNAIIGGDLTVNGNTIYVNITDLNVQDPIIGLGRGENNAPLTSNDGKDRGEQLWYYTSAEKSAFIGYDNSADKLIAAIDVTLSNEIVTVNSYGNFVVGGLEAATGSFTGNVDTGNISGTTGTFTNVAGTLSTAAQPNITSVGTLGSLSVTGNISGGNLSATLLTGTLSTAAQPNITSVGTLSSLTVLGNIAGGNVSGTLLTGTITTAAQPNVTSVGTLTSLTATGNVAGGNLETAGQVTATGNISGSTLTASGNIVVQSRQQVKFYDTDNSNFISFRAPNALTGDYLLTLPTGYGNADQVLSTNGAGTLTWVDQGGGGGGGGASQFPNSTVTPVPGSTGNFDLAKNFVQTSQEVPFETSATDPFGVNLGEVYSMMDPVGEVLEPVDLGVLT